MPATYLEQARQILADEGHLDPSDDDIADLAAELRDDAREEMARASIRWSL